MSLTNLSFFLSEAAINLRRSGVMAFITVATIAVTLLMMGAFLLVTMNMEAFLYQLQDEALITTYLKPEVTITEAKSVKLRLTNYDEIEKIQLITPRQAARELFSDPNDKQLLQIGITDATNPLPTTLRLKVNSSKNLKDLIKKLETEPEIDNISYGEDLFNQFQGLSDILWLSSLTIVILLGLASLFIVYNTVRLTLFMRREEIIIMKLVGATNWFVRGPFLVEGFIQGTFGSILSIIILLVSYEFILAKMATLIPFFTSTIALDQLIKLSAKLLMMGIVLGISGSLLSLRDISTFSKTSPEGV